MSTHRTLRYIALLVISVSMRGGSHVCSFSDTSTSCCIKNQEPIPTHERHNVPVISASMRSPQPSSDTPGTMTLLPGIDLTNLEETERNTLFDRQQVCITICEVSGSPRTSAQAAAEATGIVPLARGSTSSNATGNLSSHERDDSQAVGSSSSQIPVLSISDCGEISESHDSDILMKTNNYNQDDNTEGICRKRGVYSSQHPWHIRDPDESNVSRCQSLPIVKSSRREHSLADDAYSMHRSEINKVQSTTKANSSLNKSLELNAEQCKYCKKRLRQSSNILEHLNKRCTVLRELGNANNASNVNRASSKNTATSWNRASDINTGASTSNMSGRHFQDESGLHSQWFTESRKRLKTSTLNEYGDQCKDIKHQVKMIDGEVTVEKEENVDPQNQNDGWPFRKKASPFECMSCEQTFSKSSNLRRHIKLMRCPLMKVLKSENETRYDIICTGCGKKFKLLKYLHQHQTLNRCQKGDS